MGSFARLVALAAPWSVTQGLPATMCEFAPPLAEAYCNATSGGVCVNSTGECDAMGGFGNGDAGCGAACFCCKQPRILPTCETAGTVAMSYCLAKHDGLCMASSDDCDAVGGDFSDSGCGDDCGCCRNVGATPAPTAAPSEPATDDDDDDGGDRNMLFWLCVFLALLNGFSFACGAYVCRRREKPAAASVPADKAPAEALWVDPPRAPPPPPPPPRAPRSPSSPRGFEMVPNDGEGFVVGGVTMEDL